MLPEWYNRQKKQEKNNPLDALCFCLCFADSSLVRIKNDQEKKWKEAP